MDGDDDLGTMVELRMQLGITDDDDARLQSAWRTWSRSAPELVERCCDAVLAVVPAGSQATSLAAREPLREALARRLPQLFTGPRDQQYLEQRIDDGRALARMRLSPTQVVVAAARARAELVRALRDSGTATEAEAAAGRACDLELAVVVWSLASAREQQRLTDLRDVVVAHLPTGVVLLDSDGRVTTSARPSPRVFAVMSPNGRHWREALQPALVNAAELPTRIERARALRREVILPRLDVALPSGIGSFRVALTPLDHPLAEVLLHVEDLTDTLASEARATRAEQLAKLASMAATVAHEIRNPLAGVSAAVQVVAGTMPPHDARRAALGKVQEQVQRLGNLIGDLLSLSKPIALNAREVDLVSVASGLSSSEHGMVEVRGAGSAVADVALLTQVLFNLMQNAWQAGARAVRVDVEGAALRVIDDGPGIADELRERIFEPFFTTKTRGTGLGLPTARKIVEAMGGTLTLCASPLGGGGFEVRLPTQEEPSAPDE